MIYLNLVKFKIFHNITRQILLALKENIGINLSNKFFIIYIIKINYFKNGSISKSDNKTMP